MGYQMRTLLSVLAVSFSSISVIAFADEGILNKRAILGPSVYVASDSEGFLTQKYNLGFLPLYEHGEKYTGISYQHNSFRQGSWSSSGEVYTLTTKSINPRTALGYNVNIGYNLESGYKLVTTDSNYGFSLSDTTKAELILNRDRVETQNSLNNGIHFTLGALSVEQQLSERFSIVVMGGNMYFSDTNTRPTIRARLIYNLVPEHGVTAQLRYRQFRDTNTSVSNNYFNPEKYSETMFALAFRRHLSDWVLSGTVGVGRQSINEDPSTTTQLYELIATSPVTSNNYYFKTHAGYSKSAGFLGPNYSYRYIMGKMIFPF